MHWPKSEWGMLFPEEGGLIGGSLFRPEMARGAAYGALLQPARVWALALMKQASSTSACLVLDLDLVVRAAGTLHHSVATHNAAPLPAPASRWQCAGLAVLWLSAVEPRSRWL